MTSILSKISKAGLVLSCGFIMGSAENLLTNNSFENGAEGWQQWGAVTTTHSYAGAKAMEVSNASPQWSGISQEVPILDGTKTITVTGWMKTDNVVTGQKEWEQAVISVEFLDENGVAFKYYPTNVAQKSGTNDWTYFEQTYEVYPNATAINVAAALGNATGTASFDEFTLIQKRADGTVQTKQDLQENADKLQKSIQNKFSFVKNGAFEEGNANWTGYNTNFPSAGRDGSSVLQIHNPLVQWGGATQTIELPEEANSFIVSGWMKCDEVIRGKEGWDKAILGIEFMDSSNKKVGEYPQSIAEAEGSTEWTFYQRRYSVIEGASQVKITGQLCNAKGTVAFDDISMVLFDSAGRELQ